MRSRAFIAIAIAAMMAVGQGCAVFADETTSGTAAPAAEPTQGATETTTQSIPQTGTEETPSSVDTSEPETESTAASTTTKPSVTAKTTTKAAATQTTARRDARITSLKKPLITSLWNSKLTRVTVKWTADINADGYEIYYKQAKKKKKIVKVKAKGLYELKNLKKGKKYTVKIRSYRKQDGKTIRSKWSKSKTIKTSRTDWNRILKKYKSNDKVKELIFVKYKGNSKARLYLYQKNDKNQWKLVLSCKAYTGKRGINKKKEGDRKTPTGDFAITHAFGIKSDPGSKMSYLKVNKNHYWCADKYYNKLVDVSKKKHNCRGEHLITYTKQYAYAMNIGYNTAGKKGKGSALFLHCFGNHSYTLGCVAVSKSNMIKILKTCDPGTRICIYKE